MKKTFFVLILVAAVLPMLFCQCASSPTGERVRAGVDDIDRAIDENLPGLGPPPELGDDPYAQ